LFTLLGILNPFYDNNDLCALAGGLFHFLDELGPGFEQHMREQIEAAIAGGDSKEAATDEVRSDHEGLIDNIVPCFDEVGELSFVPRQLAQLLVPPTARRLRDSTLTGICNDLGLGGNLRFETLDKIAPQEELFAPQVLDTTTLRVSAPGDAFFLQVGSQVQLTVSDLFGNDLTGAASGTQYFAAADERVTVSPDGLLTISGTPSPYAEVTPVVWVWVGNGEDLGIGQFAIVDPDGDGDGVGDSTEVALGLDPAVDNTLLDGDGDGLNDAFEAFAGSDPGSADTDGDGVGDGEEQARGSDFLDPADAGTRLGRGSIALAGGRSALLRPDGGFLIRNVPVSGELTRVRVQGPRAADFWYGQSGFFEVANGATQRFTGSFPVATEPPPQTVRLSVTADVTPIQDTAQLTVTATLSDGTAVDATARAEGSSYSTSNPAIATVDENGLVTGVSSGIAFVTARREGAAAVTRVVVALGDPLTTVTGRVEDAGGQPVAGATIGVAGQLVSTTTDGGGAFVLANVATTLGPSLTVTGFRRTPGGPFLLASVAGITPVAGGVTEIGAFTLLPLIFDLDGDGDGVPDEVELFLGTDPVNPDSDGDSIPDGQEDADFDGLPDWGELIVGRDPNDFDSDDDGIADGDEDTDGDGLSDGDEIRAGEDPLTPENEPPEVEIVSPADGTTVTEGATLEVVAEATDNVVVAQVALTVNGGVVLVDDEAPFVFTFTVPEGAATLSLAATAADAAGNTAAAAPVTLNVAAEVATTVEGRVVDAFGAAVPGAEVEVRLQGLQAEFFDFDQPLTEIPDFTGLAPDVVKLVSAVNFVNPDGVLGPDTFGVGLGPDFAARFTGTIRLDLSGPYTFTLGSDDGARLTLDGQLVAEVAAAGDFAEGEGLFENLAAPREVPIVIEYFQAVGDAELRLELREPEAVIVTDAGRRTAGKGVFPPPPPPKEVPTRALRPPAGLFAGVAGPDGRFSIAAVPTALGPVQAEARAVVTGEPVSGLSARVDPVPGGVTDVGTVPIDTIGCFTGALFYGGSCTFGSVTGDVDLLFENDLGLLVPVDYVTPDAFGGFCAVLRRRIRYVLRQEDVECFCDATATCETEVELTEPDTGTSCTAEDGPCQDAGGVPLTCDFFCGS
jgi:protocatechuate 3,4-dioxygenase beta subunit